MGELERLVLVHKALSDETRIRMLNVLLELGELCVCDLELGLDLTQSKTSRHLGVLKQAGLVGMRREGTWAHYGISDRLDNATQTLLESLQASYGATAEAAHDVAKTRQNRRGCS